MIEIKDLIVDMQKVKSDNSSLSLTEILKMFEIRAIMNLTNEIRRMVNK